MTVKQYRTAMGKTVDMGALMLQNENVRATGNMGVNARGDKLNSTNAIIDRKSQQIKRQNKKQVISENRSTTTSNASLRRAPEEKTEIEEIDTFTDLPDSNEVTTETDLPALQGGLAAAIAKAKTVQQTKLPTPRQSAKAAGVKKI